MVHTAPLNVSSSPEHSRKSKLALPAALLCVSWVLGLAGLVLQTANPLTLNRRQLEVSAFVVEARATRLVPGEVQVVKFHYGTGEESQLVLVRNLNQTPVRIGETYLIPLVPAQDLHGAPVPGLYDVTPTGLPGQQPLVYPASDAAIRQLEQLIGSAGRKETAQ